MSLGIGHAIGGLKALILSTAIAAGIPAAAEAQLYPLLLNPEEPVVTEAQELEARAAALETEMKTWVEAARLYRTAAQLRPAGSFETARDYLKAGQLSFYAGRLRQALGDLRSAGEHAMIRGDVVMAAHAFLDGAFVAARLGDAEEARDLARRGARLADSPLLQGVALEELEVRLDKVQGLGN